MNTKEMREKRAKLVADAQALIPAEGSLTPENRVKFDALMAEADTLKADIDRIERADAADAEMRKVTPPPRGPIGGAAGGTDETRKKEHAKAFGSFLRNGMEFMAPEDRSTLLQYRDLGVAGGSPLGGSLGGFTVPEGFMNQLETAMAYYGDMFNVATVFTTGSGNPLPWPTLNDTTVKGELVAEHAPATQGDATFGQIIFGAYRFSSKFIPVSIELLQDTAVDLEAVITALFAERLGRILNQYFTTGTGTGEPTGIITAATDSGITLIGDDNATSPDPTSEVGWTDLITLEHSIDPAYRRGAKFMFKDSTLRFLKTLKDTVGEPLWLPGMAVQAPDTILGYPYSINEDMEALGTGNITVAFGQLSKYRIRRVREIFVSRFADSPFMRNGQVAFLAQCRYDGNLLDAGTHPVKYITQD